MQACAKSNNRIELQEPLAIFTSKCTVEMLEFWFKNGLNPRIEIREPILDTSRTILSEAMKNNNMPVMTYLLNYGQSTQQGAPLEENKSDDSASSNSKAPT